MYSNLMTKQTTTAQPLVSIVFMSLESVFKRFFKTTTRLHLEDFEIQKIKRSQNKSSPPG